jgi:hypothetical protein
MKTIASALSGLALSLAVAGVSFAQTPAPAEKPNTAVSSNVKKHAHKKANRKAAVNSATPAAPAPVKQ